MISKHLCTTSILSYTLDAFILEHISYEQDFDGNSLSIISLSLGHLARLGRAFFYTWSVFVKHINTFSRLHVATVQ